jgi:Tfp pilus assembly protein PilV
VKRAECGLTLLEILVALTLFTIAATSILALFAVGSAAHRRAVASSEARWIAARILAETRAKGVLPASARAEIMEIAEFGGNYHAHLEWEPLRSGGAVRLTVRVHWGATPEEERAGTVPAEESAATLLTVSAR